MSYFEGFVVAVPAANKEAYRKHAADAAPLFMEFGATRMVESWGEDVPDGKVTDFKGAVKAEPDEVVVFSWFEYPDKAARDAANERMMADPRMEAMGKDMPFDGKRMIYGGFEALAEDRAKEPMGYVDGMLVAVPAGDKQAYADFAAKAAAVFRDHGASRVIDAWGDDVPDGKVTDYRRAVKAETGETVVYSWVEWPSKEARNAAWEKVMGDPRMADMKMPFDGKRMIYGGFEPIVDVHG
jgi:uncharacterized protein YbaA (DUF1428 family)